MAPQLAISLRAEVAFGKNTKIAEEVVPMKRPVSAWSIAGIFIAGLWAAQAQAAPDVA